MTGPEEVAASPRVVSLRGEEIRSPNEPCADLIEKLEGILEMARSGEINGMVAALHHADGCTSGRRGGNIGRSIIGMLEILKIDLCNDSR